MAITAELVPVRPAPLDQRRTKGGPALGVSDRIYLHRGRNFEVVAELVDHDEQLGVAGGVGPAENFDTELVELSIAALLRTLATKHRARVPQPLLGIAATEPGFNVRADDAGRSLGAQRDRGLAFIAIGEGVHLLFDDVSGLAGRARVELHAFEDRKADLPDRVALENRASALLDQAHRARICADKIAESPESSQFQIVTEFNGRASSRAASDSQSARRPHRRVAGAFSQT